LSAPTAAFTLRYLLLSLSDRRSVRSIARFAGLFLGYPLRLLDHYFLRREASYDAACAVYFFGTKRETPIPDREILNLFRGGR
jgi:hypothetical protein